MTSRQIESFLLAGKYLSFTKAAEAAYMTRQAISQQIALLEEELEASLFVRSQNKLELSSVGQYYFDALRRMKREWSRIQEHARELALEQEIRIGCIYAMDVTKNFYQMDWNGGMQQIDWERREPFELVDRLLAGEFDLVLTFEDSFRESLRKEELLCQELLQAETLLVYRNPGVTENGGDMSYFGSHVGIISQDQLNEGKNLEKFRSLLTKFGIQNPRIKLVQDRESVETMVELGMGYTIGTTIERFPFYPNMCAVHTGFIQKIILLQRKDDKRPAVRKLFEQSTQIFRENPVKF